MRLRNLASLFACLWFPATFLVAQAQGTPAIFPDEDPQTPADYRLVWPATPGHRYEVRQSSDLQTWAVAPGFPVVAEGPELTFPIVVDGAARFFQVVTLEEPVPAGMALIPAGSFQMGDTFNEGDSFEYPVHTVFVSAFYMDKYEVTKALWDEIYTWALTHGYSFDNPGLGKAANHPVRSVNWYDVVKWCNARSENAGLVPAYYTDAGQSTVYRSGQITVRNEWVKWQTGYRLPTEAEWEKAARGGQEGRRFPWGDTISHSQANYYCLWEDNRPAAIYDVNSKDGYHPTYAVGDQPYTSPVGSFAANGYGLHDLAGNVYEWCWDWVSASYYANSPGSDPQGPSSGSERAFRGSGWGGFAFYSRSAWRSGGPPDIRTDIRSISIGFRSVRPPGQ